MSSNHSPAVNPITGKAYKKVSVNVALSRELQATRTMRDAANATNTKLLAQRDELVAALQECAETLYREGEGHRDASHPFRETIDRARAAIARAKEE